MSMPLWLAVLGYVVWAAMVWAAVFAVGLALVAAVVLYALGLLGELLLVRWRRRRAGRPRH